MRRARTPVTTHLIAVVGLWFSVWAINWVLTVPGMDYGETVIAGAAFGMGLKSLWDAGNTTVRTTVRNRRKRRSA